MRIAILMHARDRGRDLNRYDLFRVSPHWEADGHEVVPVFGTARFVPADVAILHVDLSVVPPEYLDFARRYPRCLNLAATDIRKSRFSANGVRPGDGWDGPVIIKSDANSGGAPERGHGPRLARVGHALGRAWRRLRGGIVIRSQLDYRILDHASQVPADAWAREDLFVERFLPEFEDGLYHVRSYLFLGTADTAQRLSGPSPILQVRTSVSLLECEPHPDIVALRHRLGFDYGKFDYTVHEGRAVLLDINKTTGGGRLDGHPVVEGLRRRRAQGLYGWLRG